MASVTAEHLRNLARFLDEMSAATRNYAVRADVHRPAEIEMSDAATTVAVTWDRELEQYVVDTSGWGY